ncbi:MAG: 16S rRNA (guanine(527)-N(7))-methyltransferase RsmG [Breznakibacter sp.]
MELIQKYFPNLSSVQHAQFDQLWTLYNDWNQRINVISRKDIGELYLKHVLHSLGIAKFVTFRPGSLVLDVGTGGGFPGIPLAIMFPQVQFHLVDSIAKKIMVVNEVSHALGLTNVTAWQTRAEAIQNDYDFVVSRAVTAFPDFVKLCRHLISLKRQQNPIPNGILYLKGGDFAEELKPFGRRVYSVGLSDYFDEPFFETKKLVHLPL